MCNFHANKYNILKEIFVNPEGFATRELSVPSFFESIRRSTEELYECMKTGWKGDPYDKLYKKNKRAPEDLEEKDKYWKRCNEFNMEKIGGKEGKYRNLQENVNDQKIMRTRKLMALLRDEEKFWKEANRNMGIFLENHIMWMLLLLCLQMD
jgi:uncharacterized protein with PIN domain